LNIVKTLSSLVETCENSNGSQKSNQIILSCAYVIGNILENENDLKNVDKLVKIVCSDFNDFEKVNINSSSSDASETLYCVYKFSMHPRAREAIYDESYETLKKLVDYGYQREHLYSLKILTQLVFNRNIAMKISEDKEFCRILKKLMHHGETHECKHLSEIILWSLKRKYFGEQKSPKNSVYISFSFTQSKDIAQKIANGLEASNRGIKVKNVEFTRNDNVAREFDREKVQKLISKSDSILVCLSERYRLSPRCQAEALLALEANKHIIPLVVQEGFDNDEIMNSGWLGTLTLNRDYINFYDLKHFEKSLESLIAQLEHGHSNLTSNKSKLVEKWTSSQVYEWFLKHEIHPQICELYKSVDGLTLKEIHVINRENPVFFYECLRNETNKKIDKEDYESFSQKLKNLFRTSNDNEKVNFK
jgi:hypothetical protein